MSPRWRWPLWLFVLLFVGGLRVGEASHPGPAAEIDNAAEGRVEIRLDELVPAPAIGASHTMGAGMQSQRRRRGRQRRRNEWIVETANVTCEASGRNRLCKSPADVVCVQEHKKVGSELAEAQRLSYSCGWKVAYDAALVTEAGGRSGGTGVAVRSWVGVHDAADIPTDVEWPPAHRFSLRWVQAVLRQGILIGSVYLQTGTGLCGANLGILDQIGQVLRAFGRPFVLGGDWQVDREVLEASGWLGAVGGVVVAPPANVFTCVTSKSASAIDYFVVAVPLAPLVRAVWVDVDCQTIKTHRPVMLRMDGSARGDRVQKLRRPAPIPVQVPVGCAPRPPSSGGIADALDAAATVDALQAAYSELARTSEAELVGQRGLHGEARFLGRGVAVRTVTVCGLGARGGAHAKSCGATTMCRWLGDRLLELSFLRYGTPAPSEGRLRQAGALQRKLERFQCPLKEPPAIWQWWRSLDREAVWASGGAIRTVASTLLAEARRLEHLAASRRAASWKQWAAVTAMENGARLGHRWTKPVPPWAQSEVLADGRLETAQEAANRAAADWHQFWAVRDTTAATLPSGGPPALQWEGLPAVEDIQLPDAEELRRVSRSFSRFTALGIDDFHPRHIGDICDDGVHCFIALLRAIIRLNCLPTAIALLLIVLLPKPEGGTRPIGLFPSIIRVFTRWARRVYAVPWETAHQREYWYGERGRTCDMAVWRQALTSEYASATGQCAISALLDLHKAYEHVPHEWLVKQAVKYSFNWKLVRFLIMLYSMLRMVLAGGVATGSVRATRTIVAGCSFATTLLRLALISTLDRAATAWPSVMFVVVVDDIQLQALGTNATLVANLVKSAVQMTKRGLTDECGLVVSEPKFQVLANCPLGQAAVARTRGLREGLRRHTRNLGVDYSCGKRGARTVRATRVKKMLKRMPFFRRLRAAGGKTVRLARTGIVPALLYGAHTTGVNDSQLLAIRRCTRSAFSRRTKGRSLTLDLLLEGPGTDPAERSSIEPVLAWCVALWDKWLPRAWLLRTMGDAISRVQTHPRPWSMVRGPASAVAATVQRLGWHMASAHEWVTHRGLVNVLDTAPRAVEWLVREAVERWQWRQVCEHDSRLSTAEPSPIVTPLVTLVTKETGSAGVGRISQRQPEVGGGQRTVATAAPSRSRASGQLSVCNLWWGRHAVASVLRVPGLARFPLPVQLPRAVRVGCQAAGASPVDALPGRGSELGVPGACARHSRRVGAVPGGRLSGLRCVRRRLGQESPLPAAPSMRVGARGLQAGCRDCRTCAGTSSWMAAGCAGSRKLCAAGDPSARRSRGYLLHGLPVRPRHVSGRAKSGQLGLVPLCRHLAGNLAPHRRHRGAARPGALDTRAHLRSSGLRGTYHSRPAFVQRRGRRFGQARGGPATA